MQDAQVKELVLQSLQHEMGGVKVYEAALSVVLNDELKQELAEAKAKLEPKNESTMVIELDEQ